VDTLEDVARLITKAPFPKRFEVWVFHECHVLHLFARHWVYYCLGEMLLFQPCWPWGAQVRHWEGFSCAIMLHPGGANQFCCNPPCCDNVLRRITMDAVWICAVSSKSFLFVAKDGPISVMGNQGQLKLNLRQNVP
jgi:hypothetical protein